MLSLLTLCLCIIYAAFLLSCIFHWNKIKDTSEKPFISKSIRTTVIVPARNEERNIPKLLSSLAAQDYPSEFLEIVVVDDHSTDNTKQLAVKFFLDNPSVRGKSISSPGKGKKEALAFAVMHSDAELIITTDADIQTGKQWVGAMVNQYVQSGALLVCGPVRIKGGNSFLEKLQSAEAIGLGAISASGIRTGRPMMCNGANVAFPRLVFQEVGGYEGSKSGSGDDTQLLLKIHAQHPGRIAWAKDSRAIVDTFALPQAGMAWSQRRRWASKIPTTLTPLTIIIAAAAWSVHALLLTGFALTICGGGYVLLALSFVIKIIPEIALVKIAGKFFNERIPWWFILLAQPVYAVYLALTGLFIPFSTAWKGRKIN